MKGLRRIGQLFPNLAIINGNELLNNAALAVCNMPNLEEIDLCSLKVIEKGSVHIIKNKNLCNKNLMDWSKIAPNRKHIIFVKLHFRKVTFIRELFYEAISLEFMMI